MSQSCERIILSRLRSAEDENIEKLRLGRLLMRLSVRKTTSSRKWRSCRWQLLLQILLYFQLDGFLRVAHTVLWWSVWGNLFVRQFSRGRVWSLRPLKECILPRISGLWSLFSTRLLSVGASAALSYSTRRISRRHACVGRVVCRQRRDTRSRQARVRVPNMTLRGRTTASIESQQKPSPSLALVP